MLNKPSPQSIARKPFYQQFAYYLDELKAYKWQPDLGLSRDELAGLKLAPDEPGAIAPSTDFIKTFSAMLAEHKLFADTDIENDFKRAAQIALQYAQNRGKPVLGASPPPSSKSYGNTVAERFTDIIEAEQHTKDQLHDREVRRSTTRPAKKEAKFTKREKSNHIPRRKEEKKPVNGQPTEETFDGEKSKIEIAIAKCTGKLGNAREFIKLVCGGHETTRSPLFAQIINANLDDGVRIRNGTKIMTQQQQKTFLAYFDCPPDLRDAAHALLSTPTSHKHLPSIG